MKAQRPKKGIKFNTPFEDMDFKPRIHLPKRNLPWEYTKMYFEVLQEVILS